MVCKLTFADIAGYLPYGLKVQDEDQDIWTIRQLGNVDPCRDGDVGLVSDDGHYEQYTYIDDIELVLRPMSDLYKEITDKDYNDGKPFVPLVELAKAKFPCLTTMILMRLGCLCLVVWRMVPAVSGINMTKTNCLLKSLIFSIGLNLTFAV